MAALRNTALNRLRATGATNITEAVRDLSYADFRPDRGQATSDFDQIHFALCTLGPILNLALAHIRW
jgi:hypothetical protein